MSDIQKSPVSSFPETHQLKPDSLIHIVEMQMEGYQSKKMLVKDFEEKLYSSVVNTLKAKYWDSHIPDAARTHKDVDSFRAILDYLGSDAPAEITDRDTFVNHINYDFLVLRRYMVKRGGDLETKINSLVGTIHTVDSQFAPMMTLFTKGINGNICEGKSVNNDANADDIDIGYQMKIQDGNKISNTWIVPSTGNLVVYGWLDSNECLNNKATPSAFCVLEGNINDRWEIMSVQPVVPAKNITYVGFNVQVHEGLNIRVRTGFPVGAKSNGYSNDQGGLDSLANNTANGFKCQVFVNIERIAQP